MRAGLVQLCSGPAPAANLPITLGFIREAVGQGAGFVLTPEVTNGIDIARDALCPEHTDPTLAALRAEAQRLGIWLLIGSLSLTTDDPDGRLANRSFVITPSGKIAQRYDKIHMFDVDVSEAESYRESAKFRPGTGSNLAQVGEFTLGLSICYDLRFPQLYRGLAQAGANVLSVPAAFTPVTGAAHWETLLRARAIENTAYVLAPAQVGQNSPKRATFGHSLAVDPWGAVLVDGGTEPGVSLVDLDLQNVKQSRQRIPSLFHDRDFESPV